VQPPPPDHPKRRARQARSPSDLRQTVYAFIDSYTFFLTSLTGGLPVLYTINVIAYFSRPPRAWTKSAGLIQPEQVDSQLPSQKVREFLLNEKKQRAMLAELPEMREGKEMEEPKECMINRESPITGARVYYETALRTALEAHSKKIRKRKGNGAFRKTHPEEASRRGGQRKLIGGAGQ